MATKVKLRKKKISGGRISLYLDFYPPIISLKTGKPTRRQFLKMYIFDDTNKSNKKSNNEKLRLAEMIRQKKENELNKPEIYTEYEKERLRIKALGEIDFIKYFKSLADKKTGSTASSWNSTYKYLVAFTNGKLEFKNVNEKWAEKFKEYLLTTKSNKSTKSNLSQNSAVSYFNKIKATLKQAFKDGILIYDLNSKITPIKEVETRKEYLTLEELNILVKTPCNNILLKNAALFSALTGMAWKEIENLLWRDISVTDNGDYLILTKRQKTQRDNYLPIPKQAYKLTKGDLNPKNMPSNEKVFKGLKYSAYHNKHLFQWIGAAGITKDITFHCFRHTYATLQLSKGTDLYTVSKMLGHKNIKTTQIYAKIVDDAKRAAANKIKLDL